MNYRAYAAELIGTFTLTLVVLFSLTSDSPFIPTPVAAALTLALFVYAVGPVSGAHLNPAITVSLATLKKISGPDAIMYIVAQCIGALLAKGLLLKMSGGLPAVTSDVSLLVTMAEALGAASLAFGVSSVVFDRVHAAASGLVIGGFLLIGILLASTFSNGVLNPAVALGIGSFSLSYMIGPVIGAAAAMWLNKLLADGK